MKKPHIIQVIGYKNSGKTTLVCQLIERFRASGYRVGTIKHDAHHFEIDHPGKDTWKHRQAGADVVAITSQTQTAIMLQEHTSLARLIEKIAAASVDLILVEGYKQEDYPKIALIRSEDDKELVANASQIVAIVSPISWDGPPHPLFAPDDLEGITAHLTKFLNSSPITEAEGGPA